MNLFDWYHRHLDEVEIRLDYSKGMDKIYYSIYTIVMYSLPIVIIIGALVGGFYLSIVS